VLMASIFSDEGPALHLVCTNNCWQKCKEKFKYTSDLSRKRKIITQVFVPNIKKRVSSEIQNEVSTDY
jgi:hypothetical protein